ncbi:hypothetical protein OG923_31240 [Streptomyces halstedii]|uniref:hypothetical protein n=1 Tax=Streptomyces halstedii TaxID=1944 RepID=UPI003253E24D
MNPGVTADEELRAPGGRDGRLSARLARRDHQGRLGADEFGPGVVPAEVASAVAATAQGGHVVDRASGPPAAFDVAARGLLSLLAPTSPRPEEHTRTPRSTGSPW